MLNRIDKLAPSNVNSQLDGSAYPDEKYVPLPKLETKQATPGTNAGTDKRM